MQLLAPEMAQGGDFSGPRFPMKRIANRASNVFLRDSHGLFEP